MRKYLFILLLVLMLISCSIRKDDDALNIAISSEPPTLDVMVNTSLISRIIAVGNIYEKLFVLDSKDEIALELSSGYSLSEDSRKLTILIRDGVLFHDGKEMDADDVCASMNRWLDKYATANTFVHGSRFFVVDDHAIAIESTSSLALLPYLVASSPQSAIITEKEIIESLDPGELLSSYIGTGPYMLSSWNSGSSIELGRFSEYKCYADTSDGIWGAKRANIERLSYKIVPDSMTRRLGLQSGQYDFINDVMSEDRPFLDKDSNIYMIEGNESGSIVLVFNKKEGICRDLDFRKGVSLALDFDSLMKACYGEIGYSVHSHYMEKEQLLWSLDDSDEYNKQDLDSARQYIEKSGYNGERIRILTANLSNLDKIAIVMKSELEKAGIESEIISVDWASMIERRKDPSSFDIYISAFSRVVLPQMKSYLSPSFPGWIDSDDLGVELISNMNNARSIEDAALIWKEAQEYFWATLPVVVPGHYTTAYAARSNLNGIIAQDGFFFWNATKEHL